MDDLLADFLTETSEGLVALDAALVRLERAPEDAATLSEVFRIVHTIKGTCGFLGLPRLEHVAHAAENVLGRYRDGTRPVTQHGISLILAALDRIRAIVAGAGGQPAPSRPGDDAPLTARLDAEAEGRERRGRPPPSAEPEADQPAAPDPRWRATAARPGAATSPPQTIRVNVDVLENLMTMVCELVLTRNQLLQLAAQPEATAPSPLPLQRLSHITSDLQEGVMKTRMQPIGNAWAKLPRLVRDLGARTGQEDRPRDARRRDRARPPGARADQGPADAHGPQLAPTTGWKRPDERLARRQARDRPHPAQRLSRGRAHHHRDRATTGAASTSRRSAQKALAKGLATEADWPRCRTREIHRFIFRPGFSTAAAGHQRLRPRRRHGRGEDQHRDASAARSRCARREGRGTTFIIKIPLTLAIVSALIVEAAASASPSRRSAWSSWSASPATAGAAIERINGRAGPAAAQPAAAAGQPARGCCGSTSPAPTTPRRLHRRHPGRRPHLRHHRRSRLRHRGDRGQAGGADPAPYRPCSAATPSSATAASS